MRLYIIRHAHPDSPNDALTPIGHIEAQALAPRLKRLGLHRIYSSPLTRARQTMQYTADLLGMTATIEPWAAEISDCAVDLPPWGHLMAWDVPGELIRDKHPLPTAGDWHTRPPMDDPAFVTRFARIGRDADAFIARHGYVRDGGRYHIEKPNRERIALFCHGGFGLTLLAHLLEIPLPLMWSGFWLAPSSVTTLLFDERSDEWAVPRCVGLGDVGHLHAAGLPTQTHGLKMNVE